MAIGARFRLGKDPMSWLTHFVGFLASVVGLVFLVVYSAHDSAKVTAMAIYGASLVTLFGASSVYHFMDLGTKGNRWLRRLDHSAIFFLIAGSYVPVTIHLLDGAWRITFLAVVSGLAVAGILLKLVWIDLPDKVGVLLYLLLGWAAVIPAYRILPQMEVSGMIWLVLGGLAYSIGAIVYVKQWPDPWPEWFGHHEIWHLFVLLGATSHYFMNWGLMDLAVPPF
jgi:hemolysin III